MRSTAPPPGPSWSSAPTASPPPKERKSRRKGFRIIDATCPKVAHVQAIIRKHAAAGFTVLIAGDREHPEVNGLLGFAGEAGIVLGVPGGGGSPPCVAEGVRRRPDDAEPGGLRRHRPAGQGAVPGGGHLRHDLRLHGEAADRDQGARRRNGRRLHRRRPEQREHAAPCRTCETPGETRLPHRDRR